MMPDIQDRSRRSDTDARALELDHSPSERW
jgi:hypothetical protein